MCAGGNAIKYFNFRILHGPTKRIECFSLANIFSLEAYPRVEHERGASIRKDFFPE
jgi:hypothetical protein